MFQRVITTLIRGDILAKLTPLRVNFTTISARIFHHYRFHNLTQSGSSLDVYFKVNFAYFLSTIKDEVKLSKIIIQSTSTVKATTKKQF